MVWCALRLLTTMGKQFSAGEPVPGVELLPGFLSMRSQELIEPRVQMPDGTLRNVPYRARRPISVEGRKYLPGDVVPDSVRSWATFKTLQRHQWGSEGFLEPITDLGVIRQLPAYAAGASTPAGGAPPHAEAHPPGHKKQKKPAG